MGKDLKGRELGAGIRQRKDGTYEGRYIGVDGKRKSLYGKKISDVRRRVNDARYEIEHGIFSKNPELTVNQWFELWIETYKEGKVAESTIGVYRYTFKHISKVIGYMKLIDVKTIHLQKVINKMVEEGYAYSSITLTRVTMHALFEQAVYDDYIIKNPSCAVKLPQDNTKERRVLSIDEQIEFLKYAQNSVYNYAFQFALLTGLRSGEIGGLKWEDVDFENKCFYVRRSLDYSKKNNRYQLGNPKSKSSIRTIPLKDEAVVILKDRRKEQLYQKMLSSNWNKNKEFDGLIFTTQNGRPSGHAAFNNAIKSILTKINRQRRLDAKINNSDFLKMESFSMHTLRHTFATRAFESGMKPKIVQEILGHSSMAMTTDLYMHTTDEHLNEEMRKFKVFSVG